MSDLAAHAGLFASALASATLLPGTSEAVLLGLLATDSGETVPLVATATAGNVLGSSINWVLGRFMSNFRDRRWFPVGPEKYDRAVSWFGKYGFWTLAFAWVPFVGDALTVVAGAMRIDFRLFFFLVTLGKAARYAFVAGAFTWFSAG